MTPENLRFHAAGHLAAAIAVAKDHPEAAAAILRIVKAFLEAPGVDNPPQFRESVDQAIADPAANMAVLARLEAMFCDPANTALEQGGIRMGKG